MERYDAIVLGAGAAGLMCAAEAGLRGRRVLVIDHAERAGKKILISGGGRCNFTNIGTVPERFLSANPHFARSALSRYTPTDFLALVEKYGIAWHEKTLGQLFCAGSAKQIVAMLLDEVARGGGTVVCGHGVTDVSHADGQFTVATTQGRFSAPALVIATGGPSIPRMGATGFAYDLARQFGLKVVEPRPALVPLTLGGHDVLFRELSGVSAEVVASAGGASFREAALFTHRGLSGPAILQVSSYWRHGAPVAVDFLPDRSAEWLLDAKRASPQATLRALLRDVMPDRLANVLADRIGQSGACVPNDPLGRIADTTLRDAGAQLAAWRFHPNGTEGFAKAEVTAGGISTAELSSKTMEAKRVPGLYIVGEAVDVTGWLGGYNFQWAWSSGWAAAQAI
ncbi:NAD(P)/FAD-dependent oxidoreductase [Altererythrobacter sp. FM1]|uniref:NAD(P)/FAD-dependent oxidoreductase n=1 Tax=Tsuneonella flava TaxID=2055955 RepID=UPI000C7F8B42|nr:NAD(P)/FAD-dependent oxidoreductase [Tsuneonella flava]ROT96938.1 NAD(P)/FAD-dependent oxidoreductase [Altererythrobacter sp. FM1]